MTTIQKVGITAPRIGLSPIQDDILTILLGALRANGAAEFHHGECVGGDERGAEIAQWFRFWIVAHPPVRIDWRANFPADEWRPPLDYLVRDRALVDEVDLLLGFPDQDTWRPRSGTWFTIGYAQKAQRPRVVIGPTGTLVDLADVPDVLDRVVRATLTAVLRARSSHEPQVLT